MATRSSPPPSPKSSIAKETAGGSRKQRKRVRLDEKSVFQLLKETGKDWDDIADDILGIDSEEKLDEIRDRFPTDDDRLRESIRFWLKRHPLASYRWLAFMGVSTEFVEPLPDATLTSANLHSALASLSDHDLEDVLMGSSGGSREEMITKWLMISPLASWKWLAAFCFAREKEKAVDEVKKYLNRKLEPSLTLENILNTLAQVKDLGDVLLLPDSELKEMKQLYPDLSQRQSALVQFWLDGHPAPSWELICFALYWKEEYEVLENVQNKYLKGTSETRRQLKMAMKRGTGKTSNTKVVLFGTAGSGKTCTKHVVIEEDPPDKYTSTPLAVCPVRIYRVDISPSQWKKLNRKQRDLVIAKACSVCDADEYLQLVYDEDGELQLHVQADAAIQSIVNPRPEKESSAKQSSQDDGAADVNPRPEKESSAKQSSQDGPKSKGESTHSASSLATYDDLLSRMQECSIDASLANHIVEIKRVQISDCGGQPQFHEILPVFLRGTSLYLFVFKLNEELSAYPKVKYFTDGKPICDAYPRSETNEQILEHCLRVIRSQKAKAGAKPPRIMIVGTHKDKMDECKKESIEEKDQKLIKLLLPEFEDEVEYFCLRPKKVVFPLNAKNPGDDEKKIAADIRELVSTRCAAEAVEIPLQWHGLEVLLEDLASSLKRDVISKEECLAAAQDLHFEDDAALDAALVYLDQLNLIFYYPDILPGVVFASAQVLLDKVTELVRAVHVVRYGDSSMRHKLRDKMWQKFCDYALVTAEFLAQEDFQPHYIPGLFTHHHLTLLFKKLLIFADFSDTEQFVPALLPRLPKEELGKHQVSCDPSVSAASPLVLTFPQHGGPQHGGPQHGGPLLGVFCASVVALLSDDNVTPCPWKLKMNEDDKITPGCLYRNCVQFTIPRHPGTITMIDSFNYIEVHLRMSSRAKAKVKDLPGHCRMIRLSIVRAIRKATLALNYDYSEPEFGFGCPCEQDGFHLAIIAASKDQWICSKDSDEFDDLEQNQLVWIDEVQENQESSVSLDSAPTLPQLDLLKCSGKSLKLIQRIAAKWEQIARRLYFDHHVISIITKDCPLQAELACQSVLTRWLNGEGRQPISWTTLLTVLDEADLSSVAEDLKKFIK